MLSKILLQGVTFTLFITWLFGTEMWRHTLPYGIAPGRAFEVFLYISGVLSSHPFIIHNIYKYAIWCIRLYLQSLTVFVSIKILRKPHRKDAYILRGYSTVDSIYNTLCAYDHLGNLVAQRYMFVGAASAVCAVWHSVFEYLCKYYFRLKHRSMDLSIQFLSQCRLIIAQMSNTRTDCWNFFIWPIMVIVTVSILPYPRFGMTDLMPITEQWLVYVSVALATVAHIHFGYGVVSIINI